MSDRSTLMTMIPAAMSFPPVPPPPPPQPVVALPNAHSIDFACVRWGGVLYELTEKQRPVIQLLWDAFHAGVPVVGGATLMEAAEAAGKVNHLFRDSPAWRNLIIPAERHNTYRLADPKGEAS